MNTSTIRITSFLTITVAQILFFIQIVSGQEYTYDHNGNQILDKNKGITSIELNIFNLPVTVIFENGNKIKYTYSADGIKLSKELINNNNVIIQKQDYLNGIEYANNSLQFFKSKEGYIEPTGNDNFVYVYEYKDYLQNTRTSFMDSDNDGHIDIVKNNIDGDGDGDFAQEIREEKSYYPFGLRHNGYGIIRGREHQYAFGGKELENSFNLNWYDFGARRYNPETGRWLSYDPLAENYIAWSPYNTSFNNPIFFIDPDGRGVLDFAKGFVIGVKEVAVGTAKGLYTAVTNPIDTAEAIGSGIKSVVTDPAGTYNDAVDGMTDFFVEVDDVIRNGDHEDLGKLFGKGMASVAAGGGTGMAVKSGAKAISKKVAGKLDDLAEKQTKKLIENIQGVNPTGCKNNCVLAAEATERIVRGQKPGTPGTVAPSISRAVADKLDHAARWAATKSLMNVSKVEMEKFMIKNGRGTVGYVTHVPPGATTGHTYVGFVSRFNNKIRYLDGQVGQSVVNPPSTGTYSIFITGKK